MESIYFAGGNSGTEQTTRRDAQVPRESSGVVRVCDGRMRLVPAENDQVSGTGGGLGQTHLI